MQTKQGRVLRAFYYNGEPTKVDAVVTLPKVFALEMAAANKLELIDEPARAKEPAKAQDADKANEPAKTAAAPEKGKGGKDAR